MEPIKEKRRNYFYGLIRTQIWEAFIHMYIHIHAYTSAHTDTRPYKDQDGTGSVGWSSGKRT